MSARVATRGPKRLSSTPTAGRRGQIVRVILKRMSVLAADPPRQTETSYGQRCS